MKGQFRRLAAAALALVAATCSNAQTVQDSATDAGVQRSFDAPYEKVRDAARAALILMNLKPSIEREDPEGFVIVISRPPRATSWGEVGRVIVAKSDTRPITVHALYEKRMNLPFGSSGRFGRNLFSKMDAILFPQVAPAVSSENPS